MCKSVIIPLKGIDLFLIMSPDSRHRKAFTLLHNRISYSYRAIQASFILASNESEFLFLMQHAWAVRETEAAERERGKSRVLLSPREVVHLLKSRLSWLREACRDLGCAFVCVNERVRDLLFILFFFFFALSESNRGRVQV